MHSPAPIFLALVGTLILCACQAPPRTGQRDLQIDPSFVVQEGATGEVAAREIVRRQQEARAAEVKAAQAVSQIQAGEVELGVLELDRAYAAFPNAPVLADRRRLLQSLRNQHLCDYAESLAKVGRRDEARAILLRVAESE